MYFMYNNLFTKEFFYSIIKFTLTYKTFYITDLNLILSIFNYITLINILILNNKTNHLKQNIFYLLQKFNYNKNIYNYFSISPICLNIINKLIYNYNLINSIDYFLIWIKSTPTLFKLLLKILTPNNIINSPLYSKELPVILRKYILNNKYNLNIIGRNKEITISKNIISRNTKSNLLLLGDSGIGKFSIIKGVISDIKINKSKNLSSKKFFIINMIKLKSYLNKETYINLKIKLLNWLKLHKNIILIFKDLEYNYIFSNNDTFNIIQILIPLINNKQIQILGTSNYKQYTLFNQNMLLFDKYFDTSNISELNSIDNLKILKLKILEYYTIYNIYIKSFLLTTILELTNKYIKFKKLPLKAIEILEIIYSNSIFNNNKIITIKDIELAISIITKIPYNILTKKISNFTNLKELNTIIKTYIFGQENVVNKITSSLQRSMLGIKPIEKPLGSWLLCGPSGTGKTELAKIINKTLFGSDSEIIRFDMSEYMEKHAVSKLIGSPPGYIGYGEKGLLASAIDKKPYSLLLFDEIEKAHSDISNIMLQILDDGRLTDSTGQITLFNNNIILFTSNLGCPKSEIDFEYSYNKNIKTYKLNEKLVMNGIKNYFKPEFLNRLDDILIFQPLTFDSLYNIVEKILQQIKLRLKEQNLNIKLIIDNNVKELLSNLGSSPIYGARPIIHLINELIVNPLIEIIIKINLIQNIIAYFKLDSSKNKIILNILPIN